MPPPYYMNPDVRQFPIVTDVNSAASSLTQSDHATGDASLSWRPWAIGAGIGLGIILFVVATAPAAPRRRRRRQRS